MEYKRANQVLPKELIERIQEYIEGECIYIPIKHDIKKRWGEKNGYRTWISKRNLEIYQYYKKGYSIKELTSLYYLSEKSIYRIIANEKQQEDNKNSSR